MKAGIQKRLADLEAKRLPIERLNIFRVPPKDHEDAVTGFSLDGGAVTLRLPGESLEALQDRAAAAMTDNRLVARFRSLH